MNYNYKQIVIGGAEKLNDERYCIDYFIENAQMVERDYFKKVNNFFKDCNSVIAEYKEAINKQIEKEVYELTTNLEAYQQALDSGIKYDENDKPIQEHIEYLQNEIEDIKEYTQCNYKCRVIIPTGEVTDSYHPNAKELYIEDVEVLERCIATAERELLPSVQKPNDNQIVNESQKPHFNGNFTNEELTTAFEKLKQGKYIHSESDLDSFIYICKGGEDKTFTKPINWMKSGTLLGLFIQDLFNYTDTNKIWAISVRCFTVKNKELNTNSIKVSLSKIKQSWKDRPKEYDKMKAEIINDLI